jgi:hypothetical protein
MTTRTEHDLLTGVRLDVKMTLDVPINVLWDRVSDLTQIGRFSPECFETVTIDSTRFLGRNRFPEGHIGEAIGVVTERTPHTAFAWTMLDDAEAIGTYWRYDLAPGEAPCTTTVRHAFEHGPGVTGLRALARTEPTAIPERLGRLARNMSVTLWAMGGA